MLAVSSDAVVIYGYEEEKLVCKVNLVNKAPYNAPLTSMDWNENNPSYLGTSSIDTTCTIWDINQQKVKTQLIAHDKEVYDISFS